MHPETLEWLKGLLAAAGYAVIRKDKVRTLRAAATIDRTILADTDDRWDLKNLIDDIIVERLVEAIMKAPWCVRREQEALTDSTSTRFNIELTVLEDECRELTTSSGPPSSSSK